MTILTQKGIVGLSLVTALLLGENAYAGKIMTDANVSDIVVTENKQFGFGGWNFDNIDVRIVSTDDFSGRIGDFNTTDGTYTPMGLETSFESDISNGEGVVVGHLHGKDWPVGEPAGIKIINGDTSVKHGKPFNCIMTSSYVDGAYLDNQLPEPVLCSGDFQSHKRFKVNLLPTTVTEVDAEGYGKSVDLVFNLDATDTNVTNVRYQVLQKANNYTGARLDGFKVEVLDANGSKNAALTLSLGEGEGDEGANIWTDNELANFSHGLWGPEDLPRFENGFFDKVRAYYPAVLSDDNQTISYQGDMLGGNYQEIFGNWLPSDWAPMGIFNDDDFDPLTDGKLKAYFGLAPGADVNTAPDWHKGQDYNLTDGDQSWEVPSANEIAQWTGEWYAEEHIEDVLNLGLNYIINVGENAKVGSTFTLRITPHVAADQTPPVYVDTQSLESYPFSSGVVTVSPAPVFTAGEVLTLGVSDNDLNENNETNETVTVQVVSSEGEVEDVTLTETDVDTSKFEATLTTELSSGAGIDNDGMMSVMEGTAVTVTYTDVRHGAEGLEENLSVMTTAEVDTDGDGISDATDPDDDNDGVLDDDDAFPEDEGESVDTDGDGIGNNEDTDDDNDGVLDDDDAFPLDDTESVDTDDDGTGDNADTDDDNDGILDVDDSTPTGGSSGGGCTYNPNSKHFDMTFLLMMGLGLFYPFRRKFLK